MTDPFPGTFDTTIEANKHHPSAPEPAGFGFAMAACAILLVLYVRYVRPRNRCCGGGCGRHRS